MRLGSLAKQAGVMDWFSNFFSGDQSSTAQPTHSERTQEMLEQLRRLSESQPRTQEEAGDVRQAMQNVVKALRQEEPEQAEDILIKATQGLPPDLRQSLGVGGDGSAQQVPIDVGVAGAAQVDPYANRIDRFGNKYYVDEQGQAYRYAPGSTGLSQWARAPGFDRGGVSPGQRESRVNQIVDNAMQRLQGSSWFKRLQQNDPEAAAQRLQQRRDRLQSRAAQRVDREIEGESDRLVDISPYQQLAEQRGGQLFRDDQGKFWSVDSQTGARAPISQVEAYYQKHPERKRQRDIAARRREQHQSDPRWVASMIYGNRAAGEPVSPEVTERMQSDPNFRQQVNAHLMVQEQLANLPPGTPVNRSQMYQSAAQHLQQQQPASTTAPVAQQQRPTQTQPPGVPPAARQMAAAAARPGGVARLGSPEVQEQQVINQQADSGMQQAAKQEATGIEDRPVHNVETDLNEPKPRGLDKVIGLNT